MYELKVAGMGCSSCVARISKAIHDLDASAEVLVDRPAGRVRVTSSESADAVCKAINDLGFVAEPA